MSEGRKSLLIIMLFFIVVGGTFGVINFIKTNKLKQLEVEIKEQNDTITLISEKVISRKDALNQSFTEQMFQKIPPINALPNIVNRFYTYGTETGVTVKSLVFNKADSEDGSSPLSLTKIGETIKSTIASKKEAPEEQTDDIIRAVEFDVELEGEYTKLRDFTLKMQQSERMLMISEWKLNGAAGSGLPSLSMKVSAYYAPQLEGVAGLPQEIKTYTPANKRNPIAPPFLGEQGGNQQNLNNLLDQLIKNSQ